MNFKETKLKGNYLIDNDINEDKRGFFIRTFCQKQFQILLKNKKITQINRSYKNKRNSARFTLSVSPICRN